MNPSEDPFVAVVADNIVASGLEKQANGAPPSAPDAAPPTPPPLAPANVEELMKRALASAEFRALLSDTDLGPVCHAVHQIVHNGLKAQNHEPLAIMEMMASWALWRWQREQDDIEALDPMGGVD